MGWKSSIILMIKIDSFRVKIAASLFSTFIKTNWHFSLKMNYVVWFSNNIRWYIRKTVKPVNMLYTIWSWIRPNFLQHELTFVWTSNSFFGIYNSPDTELCDRTFCLLPFAIILTNTTQIHVFISLVAQQQ